jgi:hypothetical protein
VAITAASQEFANSKHQHVDNDGYGDRNAEPEEVQDRDIAVAGLLHLFILAGGLPWLRPQPTLWVEDRLDVAQRGSSAVRRAPVGVAVEDRFEARAGSAPVGVAAVPDCGHLDDPGLVVDQVEDPIRPAPRRPGGRKRRL